LSASRSRLGVLLPPPSLVHDRMRHSHERCLLFTIQILGSTAGKLKRCSSMRAGRFMGRCTFMCGGLFQVWPTHTGRPGRQDDGDSPPPWPRCVCVWPLLPVLPREQVTTAAAVAKAAQQPYRRMPDFNSRVSSCTHRSLRCHGTTPARHAAVPVSPGHSPPLRL
jgi:hypothetical protein